MKNYSCWLLFLLIFQIGFAQENQGGIETTYYPHSITGGFGLHSRGARLFTDYSWGKKPLKWQVGLELCSLKGSKESRMKTIRIDLPEGSRVNFDKIHRFMVLSSSFGVSKMLFPRTYYNKIGMVSGIQTGPLVGFLRPYYVYIAIPNARDEEIEEVRYDPEVYDFGLVVGESQPWKHLNPTQVIAGWGAHAYTYFNLNRNMKVIRGVQLEADIKIFPKVIPILKTTPNQSWFLTVGVSYVQGRKW